MARFVYRLQKIYELRERRLKEQEQRVIAARLYVQKVEARIEEKRNEIRLLRQNMLTAPHTLMASHDEYIHKCNHDLDQLHLELAEAHEKLKEEVRLRNKCKADLEALEKHKEKAREEWLEEQKQIEMKQLDEVAGQRFFRAKEARLEEEAEDLAELEEQLADEERRAALQALDTEELDDDEDSGTHAQPWWS